MAKLFSVGPLIWSRRERLDPIEPRRPHLSVIILKEVFERQPGVRALVATFLAVLELVKLQAVALQQSELFGAVEIRKHKMFDSVFSEDGP